MQQIIQHYTNNRYHTNHYKTIKKHILQQLNQNNKQQKMKAGINISYPRIVRQRILEGARKWIGPWDGFVFILLRRNLRYFIFWRTSPPERQISSHLTTTTLCPLRSSFAKIEESLPSIWWRASTTILLALIPEPDTIFSLSLLFLSLTHRHTVLC